MRSFIVVSCFLAVASAGLLHTPLAYGSRGAVVDQNGYKIDEVGPYNALPIAAPWASPIIAARTIAAPLIAPIYAGPQHLPVIGPNGVPLDTPEVAAGKVANAVAHAEAHARNGDVSIVAPIAPLASPVIAARYASPLAVASYASYHVPAIGANGVPLDTPEVAHAKAAHYEAHIEAKVRNGDLPLVHYRKRRGLIASPLAYTHAYPQNIPIIGPNGVPLETPEVVAAKISHAAAHVEAKALNGELAIAAPYAQHYGAPIVAPIAAPVAYAADYKWVGPQHLPVIGQNGVPLDTPEVAAGKVANAVAHVEAKARNGDVAIISPLASPVIAARSYAAPLALAAPYYAAPQHIPVIGPNGVPLDTPEVAAGKIANAVAHVEAKARNGDVALIAPLASPVIAARSYAAPLALAAPYYAAPQHIPIIGQNGVPLDTPEVAAGKVANAVAHAEAKARNGDLIYHY